MKDKTKFESLLYSTLGVGVLAIALVAFNYISGKAKVRVDLTKEKLYTLSEGTRNILKGLDTPVKIRLYVTRGDNEMPPVYSSYAQRVEDLLAEYRQASGGKIEIEKLDPKPDTDAEDSANLDGVEGQMVNIGEKIYLGLAVSCVDQKVALPFLNLNREQLLEYDISRAITQVVQPEKPEVGVLSSLPVFGDNNPMAMMRGQRGAGPWVFITELKRDFEVKQIETTADTIDEKIKVLVVVHPKNLSDNTLYAIDQFLMRGGKLMVFVDPLSIMDSVPGANPLQRTQSASSALDKLTKAWGVEVDSNKVLADMAYKTRINRGGRVESMPAFLSLTKEGLNTNDVTTSQIDTLLLPFPGAITGDPVAGLKKEVLFKSSDQSQLIEKFMAEFSSDQTTKDFVASGKEYAIGVRLVGKFKSAFPDGKPSEKSDAKPDEKKDEAKPADSLKESKVETAVVLIADTDMLADQFCAQVQEMPLFGRVMSPGPNLAFIQNIVEQFSGDNNLITVRSRATLNRPFTVIRRMEEEAERSFRSRQKSLEAELQETQTRLSELQSKKTDSSQRFILSPEQQAEVEKFKKQQTEARKGLREVSKQLRRSVDSLQTRVKLANIGLVPLLVVVGGITMAVVKRRKTAAR